MPSLCSAYAGIIPRQGTESTLCQHYVCLSSTFCLLSKYPKELVESKSIFNIFMVLAIYLWLFN